MPSTRSKSAIKTLDADSTEFIKSTEPIIQFKPRLQCSICYDEITNSNVTLKCKHTYCIECFIKHMRVDNKCACCRDKLAEEIKNKDELTSDIAVGLITERLNTSSHFQDIMEIFNTLDIIINELDTLPNTRNNSRLQEAIFNAALYQSHVTDSVGNFSIDIINDVIRWYDDN